MPKNLTALKSAIQRSKYTQQQVADALDINKKTMSSYVTGRSKLPEDIADKIEAFLNWPVREMSHDPEDGPPEELIEESAPDPFYYLLVESLAGSIGSSPVEILALLEGSEPISKKLTSSIARSLSVSADKVRDAVQASRKKRVASLQTRILEYSHMQRVNVDGEKIRARIEELGLVQKWVCKRIGILPVTFQNYLRGSSQMPHLTLRRLAQLLKTSMASLTAKEEVVERDLPF